MLNDKDQTTLNRLQSAQAQLEYMIKAIKTDKTCKHSKPMLEQVIINIDKAKVIMHSNEWYE